MTRAARAHGTNHPAIEFCRARGGPRATEGARGCVALAIRHQRRAHAGQAGVEVGALLARLGAVALPGRQAVALAFAPALEPRGDARVGARGGIGQLQNLGTRRLGGVARTASDVVYYDYMTCAETRRRSCDVNVEGDSVVCFVLHIIP
jgi:hypothetical protein